MAREINLTSREWCDIIFEGKNQSYGAYVLRKESSKRHIVAFVTIAVLSVIIFSIPRLTKFLGVSDNDDAITDIVTIVDIKTIDDKPKSEPVQIEKPKVETRSTISYTPPIIKPDDQVDETKELKSMDKLNDSNAKISVMDNVGTNEITGVDPAELKDNGDIVGESKVDEVFVSSEVPPTFPGGDLELMRFLSKNIKYPTIPQEMNIQGKVVIQFVVGKDGSIEDVQIAKGVDKYLDAEAVRVIKSMPKWIPGKQSGKAVRVKYFVPVAFKLQ